MGSFEARRGARRGASPVALCLLLLTVLVTCRASRASPAKNPITVNVGGVLSNKESVSHFMELIEKMNAMDQYMPKGVTYRPYCIIASTDPIQNAINVCDDLIANKVYAVIVSHPPMEDHCSGVVSLKCGFNQIPVIGISSRDSFLSYKSFYGSFVRTVPPYSHQADVWLELLKHFHYMKVIFIHSSDTDGTELLRRFRSLQDDDAEPRVRVETAIEFHSGLDSLIDQLLDVKNAHTRVYLVHASKKDAGVIFRDAGALNMVGTGYVWIVTEEALGAYNVPEGALGLKLINATAERAHIQDSIFALTTALRELTSKMDITEPPSDCEQPNTPWSTGRQLYMHIRSQKLLDGQTGTVAFDENGDRMNAEYDVVNVKENRVQETVGQFYYHREQNRMQLKLDDKAVLWPGRARTRPFATHLKVLTIAEKPFVFVREPGEGGKCTPDEIPCTEGSTKASTSCCRGFCMDLLRELAKTMNFTYSLELTPDGMFGGHQLREDGKMEWTGLVGELVNKPVDMVVAPLTINRERAEFIEFSEPFGNQGITILQKKPTRPSVWVLIFQPFSLTVWMLLLVSVHVVALTLFLLDRYYPFSWFGMDYAEGTHAITLSSAVRFTWGVLLKIDMLKKNAPRSPPACYIGWMWTSFCICFIATYTARLTDFHLEPSLSKVDGINDGRLGDKMAGLSCATVKGSAVDTYLKGQEELSSLYRTMEANNYDTVEDAIADVKRGKLSAFIWDSSQLDFEAARDCELVTAGEVFGRSGYGIGLQKGSPWARDVFLAILDFRASGFMNSLDDKWILPKDAAQCQDRIGSRTIVRLLVLVAVTISLIKIIAKKHEAREERERRWRELARPWARPWARPGVRRGGVHGVRDCGCHSCRAFRRNYIQ